MITVDHHLRAITGFDQRVSAVRDDSWGLPVDSCPGWDVERLVSYVTTRTAWLARLLDGDDPDQIVDFIDRHCDGVDGPVASWRRAFADARAVLDQTTLDGEMPVPTGLVPASSLMAEACCEVLVHTWDLATAIGADARLDDVLVDTCSELFEVFEVSWRERGVIGRLVPAPRGADAQSALLARFGRS